MVAGNEILFGRIAVHNGIITVKQLEECLDFRRDRVPSKHIGQVLIERGLLNEAQARAILVTQRRNLHRERPGRQGEELKTTELFVKRGKVSREDVRKARAIQEEMESRGLFPALGDILVQMGKIRFADLSRAHVEIGRRLLWCGSCGKKYRAVGWRPGRDVFCRKCGAKLAARVASAPSPEEAVFDETSLIAAEDVSFAVFPQVAPEGGADRRPPSGRTTRGADQRPKEAPAGGDARVEPLGVGETGEAQGESRLRVTNGDSDGRREMLDVSLPSAMLAPPEASKPFYRPRVGDVLGGCKLEKKIGVGGMGEIYKARHLTLEREVAIKVLSSRRMREAHLVQRFVSEGRAAARLDHPNIVTVYHIDEKRGTYFIVMQFVDGKSIGDILKEKGPFGVGKSLAVVRQTALALDYAHRQRMVHRDIKSGNVMLVDGMSPDKAGHVIIVDFGLTKDFAHETSLTSEGMVVGTVQYMSPEQADGQAVDGRSDLYSLGITWYEMLTGTLPFHGETPWAVLMKQQSELAPDVRKKRPEIPRRVAKAVSKLLEKAPAKRFQRGADLAQEIESIEKALE